MKKPSLLDTFLEPPKPSILDFTISTPQPLGRLVPNKFPTIPTHLYRIAIIGEAPGTDEERAGAPFVGASGQKLDRLLSLAGIAREACFVGNVCQHRPFKNKIAFFDWNGDAIQSGIEQLTQDLETFKPTLIICLGNTSLHLLKEGNVAPPKHKSGFKWPNSIQAWRGSTFLSGYLTGTKCLATLHPAFCLRQFNKTPILGFDLLRAKHEATFPELRHLERNFYINLSVDEIVQRLEDIKTKRQLISIDIEGGVNSLTCIGIATSATEAFIVPFTKLNGASYYETTEEECRIWRALASVLADTFVPKCLQNSLYDRFVLQYTHGLVVGGTVDDTMLKHWEVFCEFEKSLAFQTSIYTNDPYYKSDRKSNNRDTFFRYCCRDAAITYEINVILDTRLTPTQRQHYQFNLDLLNPVLYMENSGILYDNKLAKQRLTEVKNYIYTLQNQLDTLADAGINQLSDKGVAALVSETMCYKREPWRPKKQFESTLPVVENYLRSTVPLTDLQRGHISVACKRSMNIKSPEFKDFLYRKLKLPIQVKKHEELDEEGNEETSETSDEAALLTLKKLTTQKDYGPNAGQVVDLALQLSGLRTRAQMLAIHADQDGRVRCGYNVVGTETGRFTCYTSPTGSGYNLQTIPPENNLLYSTHPLRNGMRDLFVADPSCFLFQCDLSGADGWTVGAHLAALGDSTMLDDLQDRLKPAAIICYMLRHGNDSLRGKSRQEVKELLKEVKKEDWDYFACKQGIWGTCYLMGPDLLATVIAKRSEGRVWLSRTQVEDFRKAVFARYNIGIWHRHMAGFLKNQPYPPTLTSASGHVRKFFGRRDEVLGNALAHEPQANTTYATNLAAWRLWNDKENRILPLDSLRSSNSNASSVDRRKEDNRSSNATRSCSTISGLQASHRLRIEPLHQIHDALLGQFRIEDTTWAIARLKSYFDNELVIAGQKITIPFEGVYGTNWAFDKDSKKGEIK